MTIAINGFGRIGRTVFKIAFERPGIDIVAVNDVVDAETAAYLLQYDSAYGIYNRSVEAQGDGLVVDGESVKMLTVPNPAELPWEQLGVDVVVESTGIFLSAEGPDGGYADHVKAGAKKVILTAPARDEVSTLVPGVNDQTIDLSETAFSCASCTTNCMAPVAKVLHDAFGVEEGYMTSIHAYTNDQAVLDRPHPKLRRGRAAAVNIIPTSTGAAVAVGKVIPELLGKIDGMAMRVPTPIGSAVDFVGKLSKRVSKDELNAVVKEAAEGPLKGVLAYSEAPLVSMDVRGNSHSAVFDSTCTMVMNEGFIKVIAWYDNEFGYSTRIVDLAQKIV